MLAGIGSSPLARGLLPAHVLRHAYHRIIPARAGFTRSIADLVSVARDHPRSRGVYITSPSRSSSAEGSSPLARGLPCRLPAPSPRPRIIPARAGFTMRTATAPSRRPDHPRSRGVYTPNQPTLTSGPGSSPLARGLQHHPAGPDHVRRIIPARAGFTPPTNPPSLQDLDHPRSRGVYSITQPAQTMYGGSSPLARGLRSVAAPADTKARIIPARAGFTSLASQFPPFPADHPRSRGVYPRRRTEFTTHWGSSPLARGLPAPPRPIPTH